VSATGDRPEVLGCWFGSAVPCDVRGLQVPYPVSAVSCDLHQRKPHQPALTAALLFAPPSCTYPAHLLPGITPTTLFEEERDPIMNVVLVPALQIRPPGHRPVCFHSPIVVPLFEIVALT